MYYLLRKASKVAVDICEGVDEIEYTLVNNMFNLYCDGL